MFVFFLSFFGTRLDLCSMSLCVFEFFYVFLFPGTCLEALLKDWSARDAACMPSFYDPDITEQYDGSLSLGSQKVSESLVSLPAPLFKVATYKQFRVFFFCRICSGW